VNGHSIHKNHNAEDVRLKARPAGRNPKASLCVIVLHHAISMLSKQCLDTGFWVSPEFMIINQSCPRLYSKSRRNGVKHINLNEFLLSSL